MRRARTGIGFAMMVLLAGCIGSEIEVPEPSRVLLSPGAWAPFLEGVPRRSDIAVGDHGIAFAGPASDGSRGGFRVQYWVEGTAMPHTVAELDGGLIGVAMQGEVIHVAYTPPRGVATFWRVDTASGIHSVDPVRADDRATSSIKNQASAMMVGSTMYLFGGCCQERPVYAYDTIDHQYRMVATLPVGTQHVEHPALAVKGREILVYFWPSEGDDGGSLYNFDPSSSKWTRIARMEDDQRRVLPLGAFPLEGDRHTWLVHTYGVSKAHANGTLESKRGYHAYLTDEEKFRHVDAKRSAAWHGELLVVGDRGGVYRWTPPDEAAWATARTVPSTEVDLSDGRGWAVERDE